jgi:hypothetical protein
MDAVNNVTSFRRSLDEPPNYIKQSHKIYNTGGRTKASNLNIGASPYSLKEADGFGCCYALLFSMGGGGTCYQISGFHSINAEDSSFLVCLAV